MSYVVRLRTLKPKAAQTSGLADMAHSFYQIITVSLFLETMQRLHLRQMSYKIIFFSSRATSNFPHYFHTSNYDYDSAWPNYPCVSVIITNYYKLSSLSQQTYISQFLWISLDIAEVDHLSHTAAIKGSARVSKPNCHPPW